MRQAPERLSPTGQHQRETPNFVYPLIFVVCACVIFAITIPGTWNAPMMGSMTSPGTNFAMTDDTGKPVSDRSWPGKFLLVYFGYTHCPDICPTSLATVAGAMKDLGRRADEVKPLFITVDPSRDTPAVLKSYLALFSPRITGLTGTPAQLAEAAQNYGAQFKKIAAEPGEADYSMAHTASLYLLYPSGALAKVIPYGETAKQLAAEIANFIP